MPQGTLAQVGRLRPPSQVAVMTPRQFVISWPEHQGIRTDYTIPELEADVLYDLMQQCRDELERMGRDTTAFRGIMLSGGTLKSLLSKSYQEYGALPGLADAAADSLIRQASIAPGPGPTDEAKP